MAHYFFDFVRGDEAPGPALHEQATGFVRVRMWGIDADEPHLNALAADDLILVYLGAPERKFIGAAELALAVHDWTPSEAQVYPGPFPGGVLLAQVEEWDPPVPQRLDDHRRLALGRSGLPVFRRSRALEPIRQRSPSGSPHSRRSMGSRRLPRLC